MSLTEDESEGIFFEAAHLMRERSLGWIMDEVEATIAFGKLRRIRINRRKRVTHPLEQHSLFSSPQHQMPQTESDAHGKQEFTIDEYSNREKLQLLLDALAEYVKDINDIAAGTQDLRAIAGGNLDTTSVLFASKSGDVKFEVGQDMVISNTEAFDVLAAILARK